MVRETIFRSERLIRSIAKPFFMKSKRHIEKLESFVAYIGGLNLLMCMQLFSAEPTGGSQPQTASYQTSERQAALLELFTSEGCSSCPPAEAWLSRLKDSPRLWRDFVPVAFHVDYWDSLGWPDQWGSPAFSDRQRRYARSWRSNTVYTPGFVLNGKEWPTWSSHKSGPPALSSAAGVLKATSSDLRRWQIEFSQPQPSQAPYEVHAALLGSGITSEVRGGENNGRHLLHDFVALELAHGELTPAGNEAKGEVRLSVDAQTVRGHRLGIALWVTAYGSPVPLQATGGWFPGK